MANWIFQTPTVSEGPAAEERLFQFYKLDRGVTIVRDFDGDWIQLRYAVEEDLNEYPVVYAGGYKHIVDDATKASLIAGNVGVTEANFTAA